MNHFKLAFVVCLIASQLLGSTDFAYSQTKAKQKADSIFFGGTIITMEGKEPSFAEAVAVGTDKIIAVGSKDNVLKTRASKTRLIDLKGQTLIPGVIDPHLHLPLAAIYFLCNVTLWADEDWRIPGVQEKTVRTQEDFLTELRKAEGTLKDPEEWLIPFGYAEYFHGIIGRRDLDKISLTRPIMLYHRSTHEVILNTKAMEDFGFTGNNIPNDPMVNADRGFFAESAFFRYVGPKLLAFMMQGDRWETFLRRALEYMHRNGLTTVADMLAFDGFTNDKDQLTRFRKVIDAPDVPLRTYMVSEPRYVYESKGADAAFQYMKDQPVKSGENIIYLKDAKLFADGGFFGQQMRMKNGFTDGHQGVWITPPELFTKIAGLF